MRGRAAARVMVFAGAALLAEVLLAAAASIVGLTRLSVDIALVVLLYVTTAAERRPARLTSPAGPAGLDGAGVAAVLLLGYPADLLGGGLLGERTLSLGVVYLLSRLIARQVYLAGGLAQATVTFMAGLVGSAVVLAIHAVTGGAPGLAALPPLLLRTLLTAAVAPSVMRACARLDRRLGGERRRRGLTFDDRR